MTFDEKIAIYEQVLISKGEKKSNASPPLYRLLWKLGLELPPPIFAGFIHNLIVQGGMFAIGWGTIMWFMMWRNEGKSLYVAIAASLFAGILFGIAMAVVWRRRNKKLGLGPWKNFPGNNANTDSVKKY